MIVYQSVLLLQRKHDRRANRKVARARHIDKIGLIFIFFHTLNGEETTAQTYILIKYLYAHIHSQYIQRWLTIPALEQQQQQQQQTSCRRLRFGQNTGERPKVT